jgi:hypothetical protein
MHRSGTQPVARSITKPLTRRKPRRPRPADPLGAALAAAARLENDPALKQWAERLAADAEGGPVAGRVRLGPALLARKNAGPQEKPG